MTIRQLHSYLHLNKNWGGKVEVLVRRGTKDIKLTFQFPDEPPY